MQKTDNALIVVDYQKGFIPLAEGWTAELPVEGGWLLAPRINELMKETKSQWGLIIGTRDWHPRNHMSFASQYPEKNIFETLDDWQMLWPDHCIENTPWAEYHDDLDISLIDRHVIKWYDPATEMYSWFAGKEQQEDEQIVQLTGLLKQAWVKTIKLVGLATDYCVQSTAVDAVKNWFKAMIDSSAIAWVAIQSPEDTVKYLEELRKEEWVEYV